MTPLDRTPPVLRGGLWIALLMCLIGLGIGTAPARDLTQVEKVALVATVERFDSAMRDHRFDQVIEVLPPRIITRLATQAGIDVAMLRETMVQQVNEALKHVGILSFSMNLDRATYQALSDGTPYALIPTETVLRVGSGTTQTDANSLAMMDGGTWYLLDVNKAGQVALLTQAYPEFGGVAFGGKTTKAVP